jgi:hypothetical protein
MNQKQKEIAGAVAGVLASVAGWRMASRMTIGLSFPGTAVAVTGLGLASICDATDPAAHCKAGRLINLPGRLVGDGAVKLIDSGVEMVAQRRQVSAGRAATYGRIAPPKRRR